MVCISLLCICVCMSSVVKYSSESVIVLEDYIWGNYSNSLCLHKQLPSGAEGVLMSNRQ